MGLCVLGMADTLSEPSSAATQVLTRQRQNTQPMCHVGMYFSMLILVVIQLL